MNILTGLQVAEEGMMIKGSQTSCTAGWREVSGIFCLIKKLSRVVVLQESNFLPDLWLRVALPINPLPLLLARGGGGGQAMAPTLQGDHQAAEAAQEQNEMRSEAQRSISVGGTGGMGSGWSPGGLLGGSRRFRKGFQDCVNSTSKGIKKGREFGGAGEGWGTLRKGLAHRRHSVDFLKRKVRLGREKGGG